MLHCGAVGGTLKGKKRSSGEEGEDMGTGVYFRSTTPAQRRLLFETWQATGDVEEPGQPATWGRGPFNDWKKPSTPVANRRWETTDEHTWPGPIFAHPAVAYADARHAFVAASTAPQRPPRPEKGQTPEEQVARKEAQRLVRHQETALRAERRAVRAQRRQEDKTWRDLRAARRNAPGVPRGSADPATEAAGRAHRAQRRATLEQRQQEDS